MKAIRRQKGAVMALVAICSMFLIILGVGFFQLSLYLCGEQEVRNAVDAGVLNVGNKAPAARQLKVTLADPEENQFADVLDAHGEVGLTNINRVWGKALLVNLNAQAMGGSGQGGSHAEQVYQAAQRLSKRLADLLSQQKNLHPLFNEVAQANSARALGGKASVSAQPGGSWRTSYVDRGSEANISFNADQLPGNSDFAQMRAVPAGGQTYLPGYTALQARDKDFFFVPFRIQEKPHLIAGCNFQANTLQAKKIAGLEFIAPNAFSASGQALSESALAEESTACVVANPQRQFQLAIPHAFVRIRLGQHKSTVNVNGQESEQDYTPGLPDIRVTSTGAGVGTLTAITAVGLEYMPPNLYQAIYGMPGNHEQVTRALIQRLREIRLGFSEAELMHVLQSAPVIPGVKDYYIYPVYSDLFTKAEIKAGSSAEALASAPWLRANAQAEGAEENVASEFSFGPDILIPVLTGAGIPIYGLQLVMQTGTQTWKAGTGYDGCLGELKIERQVQIISTGQVIPPP